MKAAKKIGSIVLAVCLGVLCFGIASYAADGSISFTDPQTAVGEMVEVKCVIRTGGDNLGSVQIELAYDAASLRFDSGSGVASGGDGNLTYSSSGGSSEESFSMTFQALQEGAGKVTITSVSVNSASGDALTLEEGDSTVTIGPGDPSKIQAETTAAADDMQIEVNGEAYTLSDNFADMDIPEGYTRTTVSLNGQDRQMVTNETSGICLGYLIDSQGVGDFFVYEEDTASFCPYGEINISDMATILVLNSPSKVKLPSTYEETTLTLNGKDFPVWGNTQKEGYYVLYAMNSSSGEKSFYQYDSSENTYQRFDMPEEEEEAKEAGNSFFDKLQRFFDRYFKVLIIVLLVLGIAALLFIIVLAVKLRNRDIELDDLYDEYGIDLEDKEPEGKANKPEKRRKYKQDEDFFDEEDDFEQIDLESEDFEDEDFDERDYAVNDFGEEDFGQDDYDEDEDIFSDKKLKKYDTKSIRREGAMSVVDEDDGLDELFEDLSKEQPKKKAETDTFNISFIDLD